MGSGTESDPWNGAVEATQQFAISGANVSVSGPSGNLITVTIVSTTHPFNTLDHVLMSGFDGPNGELLNGTFVVNKLSGTSFSYTLPYNSVANDGLAPASPFAGSIKCQKDPYRFDAIMRSLPTGTPVTVHLGPGLFQTKGYLAGGGTDVVGWRPFSGMHIQGSGISLTILQLVQARGRNKAYYAIGVPGMGNAFPLLESFEAQDLTVDSNIANQPSQSLSCSAIFVRGNHTRFRRVRAINFGRQGLGISPDDSMEPFVLAVTGPNYSTTAPAEAQPVDCVIEECVVEQPGLNSVKEISCLTFLGGESNLASSPGIQTYPTSCSFRNCIVNCEYQQNPVEIAAITLTPGVPPALAVATVTTRKPHGLANGQWIRISGVRVSPGTVSGQFDNGYNGSYPVSGISGPNPTTFQYTPDPAIPGNALPASTTDMWVGRWPSERIFIELYDKKSGTQGPGNWTMVVTTRTAHYLTVGSTVVITGALVGPPFVDSSINGRWQVTEVSSSKIFTCLVTATADPGAFAATDSANIGITFQGMTGTGGADVVVEGNQISNCTIGGPYTDTGSTKSIVIRNNHYRRINTGPTFNFSGGLGTPLEWNNFPSGTGLTRIGATNFATLKVKSTSDIPHGLSVGQSVRIRGAVANMNPNTLFNGDYVVSSIPDPTSFTYEMAGPPGANFADAASTVTIEPVWETRDCLIESNVFELAPSNGSTRVQSRAISIFGGPPKPPANWGTARYLIFRRLNIHSNWIRWVDYAPQFVNGRAANDGGILVMYCENAVISQNLIDLPLADGSSIAIPMQHQACVNVTYFNNRDSSGRLIPGAQTTSGVLNAWWPDLAAQIEDSLALALL